MFASHADGAVRWPDEPPDGVEPVAAPPELVSMGGVTYALIPTLTGFDVKGEQAWAMVRLVAFLNDESGEWRPTGFVLAASSEEEAMPRLRELILMIREKLGEMEPPPAGG